MKRTTNTKILASHDDGETWVGARLTHRGEGESDESVNARIRDNMLAEIRKALPAKLKKWRRIRNFTQDRAAARLSVSLRTYQEWEQGRMTPRGIALSAVLERIK